MDCEEWGFWKGAEEEKIGIYDCRVREVL